jgi:catechol 2,3-dioxygenase-like lactoylglutathione lyase family enzyme
LEDLVSRIQLALNVDNLDESIAFYSKLFNTEPAKVRPGYANFAVAEPPVKLVLVENPGQGGTLNHLGVEVPDVDTVDAEQTRLAAAGFASIDERGTTCCYAKQDKFWVEEAPNGERWEIYTVLEDSQTFFGEPSLTGPACCGGPPARPSLRRAAGPTLSPPQPAPAAPERVPSIERT